MTGQGLRMARWAPGLVAGLSACAPAGGPGTLRGAAPQYLGITVAPLDAALFRFGLAMKGVRSADDVDDYGQCAAAGYALKNGFGFARHVETRINERGGIWRADAVYTISPTLPRGIRTIDAEVTVADCAERGIPTE